MSLVEIEIKTEKIVGQLRRLLDAAAPHYATGRFGGKKIKQKLKFQRFESFLVSLKEATSIKIVTKYIIDRNDKGNIFVQEKLPHST